MQLRLDRIPNRKLFELAISDKDGKVEFHTSTIGSGLSSIYARRDVGIKQEVYRTILVECKTLDTIIREQKLDRINLLKMDIEGHELRALHGAKDAIAAGVIEMIMFEFGSANVNSRTFFRDFWDLLNAKYNIFIIAPAGRLVVVDKYSEDLEYFRGSSNYLAIWRSSVL